MTTYRISCDIAGESQHSAEYLGDAYGRIYPTIEDAESIAAELQRSVSEYGLHPATHYEVVES